LIAGDLIRQAQASGIELRLVGGKVKAIGPREAVARLIEPLRQHREALTMPCNSSCRRFCQPPHQLTRLIGTRWMRRIWATTSTAPLA